MLASLIACRYRESCVLATSDKPVALPFFRTTASYLNLAVEIALNSSNFFLRSPRPGLRGHTYRMLQGLSRLRRISCAFSLPAPIIIPLSMPITGPSVDSQFFLEILHIIPPTYSFVLNFTLRLFMAPLSTKSLLI